MDPRQPPLSEPGAEMLPGLRAAVDDSRVRAAATRRRRQAEAEPAAEDPVARVLVDLPLAHLDRPFDYVVPASMSTRAVPGARVKVRFAGQDVDGWVVERASSSGHPGRLQPLRRAVSAEVVLTPEIVELSARVARRYAGSRADVLRLAVPPRHATTEGQAPPEPPGAPKPHDSAAWAHVRHGVSFLGHLAAGGSPRAVWSAAPGDDWPAMVAQAVAAVRTSGRGVVVCVPDGRDVDRVSGALASVLGDEQHVTLTADAGPAARYRDFLAVSRGAARVVVGTRSAVFAPVHDLGLVVIWDDGDDLHSEPRAPYPHSREVLLTRADQQGTAVLVGGFARTPEADLLVGTGWARELDTPREELRRRVRVDVVESADRGVGTRLPQAAREAVRDGLRSGPVLVQSPRSGYAVALACEACREPARCRSCHGSLGLTGATSPPRCRWCGQDEAAWRCVACGHRGLRAPVVGEARTAEELGRLFPGTTVRTSRGERVLTSVGDRADIVVATVGAEPVAAGGYASVLLLDTWLTLARDDLRVTEEALRRWLGAAGLVRPGGQVVAVGDPAHPALQALVRWDPVGLARREAADRAGAHLPPAARLATLTGSPGAVDDALTLLAAPEASEVLGPVPAGEDEVRAVIRVPRSQGAELSDALGELQRVRSARKLDPVRIRVDPPVL